jgi:hypothetical protein
MNWLDSQEVNLSIVYFEFKKRFPMCDHSKLNGWAMRMMVAGRWVPVKMGSRQVYEIWVKEDFLRKAEAWNERVTSNCLEIPSLPGVEDRNTEVLRIARELSIKEHLTLVGDVPRKFK